MTMMASEASQGTAAAGTAALVRARALGAALGERYRALIGELASLRGARKGDWTLAITVDHERAEAYREEGAERRRLASVTAPLDAAGADTLRDALGRELAEPGSVVIRVDPSMSTTTTLPLPTREDGYIRAILRNRVERLGPWRADKALFGYRVEEWSDSSRQAHVKVAIVSRAAVEGLMATLGSVGIGADLVEVDDGIDGVPVLRLLSKRDRRLGRGLLSVYGALLAGLLVLIVGAIAYTGHALDRLEHLQRRSDASGDLAGAPGGTDLIARKAHETLRLRVLSEVSRILPDNTWLTALKIHGSDLELTGKSHDVPAVIGALQSSGLLDDVHFSAPTVQAEGESAGEFSVSASVHDNGSDAR
jgi:general secretion pathway protein L